jgi:hypothetical protein
MTKEEMVDYYVGDGENIPSSLWKTAWLKKTGMAGNC